VRAGSPPENAYRYPGRRDRDLRLLFVSGPEVTPGLGLVRPFVGRATPGIRDEWCARQDSNLRPAD
jgi:hypothetical protein